MKRRRKNHDDRPKLSAKEIEERTRLDTKRSIDNEQKVLAAARELQKQNSLISDVVWAKRYGDIDEHHIDILIELVSSLAFSVQVKSSDAAVKHHYGKYPHIFAINPEKLAEEEIVSALELAIKNALINFNKYPT